MPSDLMQESWYHPTIPEEGTVQLFWWSSCLFVELAGVAYQISCSSLFSYLRISLRLQHCLKEYQAEHDGQGAKGLGMYE